MRHSIFALALVSLTFVACDATQPADLAHAPTPSAESDAKAPGIQGPSVIRPGAQCSYTTTVDTESWDASGRLRVDEYINRAANVSPISNGGGGTVIAYTTSGQTLTKYVSVSPSAPLCTVVF